MQIDLSRALFIAREVSGALMMCYVVLEAIQHLEHLRRQTGQPTYKRRMRTVAETAVVIGFVVFSAIHVFEVFGLIPRPELSNLA